MDPVKCIRQPAAVCCSVTQCAAVFYSVFQLPVVGKASWIERGAFVCDIGVC